jgi:hypothetical protein
VGTSLAQPMREHRDQFHGLRLGESLDAFNATVVSFLEQAQGVFVQQTGDPVAAQQPLFDQQPARLYFRSRHIASFRGDAEFSR